MVPNSTRPLAALLIAGCAAALFTALAARDLERQGLYYDEVHQAAASFAWVGHAPEFFARAHLGPIPLLNLTYSGALKSALYGAWMRTFAQPFGVASWRWCGVLLGAAGVFVFVLALTRRLAPPFLLLAACLIATDTALLVTCRHDWGPVALGFLLRALLIATALPVAARGAVGRGRAFVLGAILGLMVFEKLSAVVWLGPLVLLALVERSLLRRTLAFVLGGLTGGLPLLVVNAHSWMTHHELVSLADVAAVARDRGSFWSRLAEAGLSPGGSEALYRVTGTHLPPWAQGFEVALAVGAVIAGVVAWWRRPGPGLGRLAGLTSVSWILVLVGVALLPARTDIHHYALAVPLPALALATALQVLWSSSWPRLRRAVSAIVIVLVMGRAAGVMVVIERLQHGPFAPAWDPEVTLLARACAARPADTLVVAADWGVALPVYCLANGREHTVIEPFVHGDGASLVTRRLDEWHKREMILVRPRWRTGVADDFAPRIMTELRALPGWTAAPLEGDLARLRGFEVLRFVRS